jgi:zinc protease
LRGARRTTLTGPGTTPFLELAWAAPSFSDPRAPATVLLDVILGGETRLFSAGSGFFRSREHPSSRLYRKLVDPGLAVSASSEWRPRVHPGLFTIDAQAAEGVSLGRLERAILAEVDRLVHRGPTAGEMRDAREKLQRGAELAYEGATRTAFRIGYFSALASPEVEPDLLARLMRVRAADVRMAAGDLFRPERSVTIGYEPSGRSKHAA